MQQTITHLPGPVSRGGSRRWASLRAGMRALSPAPVLLAQRGHLFPWSAVFLGLGIGLYFALPVEPGAAVLVAAGAGGVLCLGLVRPLGAAFGPVALGVMLTSAGLCLASARAHLVAAPVLDTRYYGPVQGRIVDIDRSAADALRLTLDQLVLADLAPDRTPGRVRVSLQSEQPWLDPVPGTVIVLTAHLDGPNGPVEPGDFDFRLHAWFAGLGAVGYTRTPVLVLTPPEDGLALWLSQVRMVLSQALRDLVPGDPGGLAAAVMTGDRSGLSVAASDSMRDANLYHVVSISGMHMGMLVAIVFGLVRTSVALIPPLALRVQAKKVAAAAALPVAAFYLALAGRDVATERAFVMAAVMLGAVLLDRQALTLRSVAMAALIVLALRPESLLNPGFQMSFAAVIALVAAFQALRRLPPVAAQWRWLVPAFFLVFSSLVAGTATAPFAAAHFNRIAHYGLIANLLAVPVMGMVVMPAALLLAVLGPLGLTEPARSLVDWGCRWILGVSDIVAGMDGAVSAVIAPPPSVLPLFSLGALIVILWQGRVRWAGVLPILIAAWFWTGATRPLLLVSGTGGLVGVLTDAGRALSQDRAEAFVSANWLENDGAIAPVSGVFAGEDRVVRATVAGVDLIALRGTMALQQVQGCDGADILIVNEPVPDARPCLVLDPVRLAQTGALAGYEAAGGLVLRPADQVAGDRLWTRAARDGAPLPGPLLVISGPHGAAPPEPRHRDGV